MRYGFRLILAAAALFILAGCNNQREQEAKQLYQLYEYYMENSEFDKCIKILQRLQIDYEDTEVAELLQSDIETVEELRQIRMDNSLNEVENTFSRIGIRLDSYHKIFKSYPVTVSDLDKIASANTTDWNDPWGNAIYYKPVYSSPDLPAHKPDGYVLACFGRDSLPGGDGLDRDHFFKNGSKVDEILGNN